MEERQRCCPAIFSSQFPSCSTLQNPRKRCKQADYLHPNKPGQQKMTRDNDNDMTFSANFNAFLQNIICKSGVIFTPARSASVSNVMQRSLGAV